MPRKPKLNKLSINRDKLRQLTDSDLAQANGGALIKYNTTFCSTESDSKCNNGHGGCVYNK
jgi:hypothetical protein